MKSLSLQDQSPAAATPAIQSESVLREQYASLGRQIPLMYTLMFLNVAFLSLITGRDEPDLVHFSAPLALSAIIAARAGVWLIRRGRTPTPRQIHRYLRNTIIVSAVLSALFGGWGLYLFSQADPFHSTAIALYIFVGSISCCYCLQALPLAARFVLLFGATPVTLGLLLSQDWYFAGIGLTFVLAALVILRTIATTRSAVFEVLRSRSEMASVLAALQRSEEHYRYSVELNPQIPWISDAEGRVLELSPRWTVLTGVDVKDALGWGWTAAVHPDDLAHVLALWNGALVSPDGSGADIRYRLRHADGSFRWCRARANPRRDGDGRIISWYGNLEDIHAQVTAELALRESEERYRLASRATNDVIWDWSHTADRIEWGSGVEHILGYPDAAMGTTTGWWRERIHPDDLPAVLATYDRVRRNAQDGWSHEYRFRHATGSYVNLFSRGYVVRAPDGTALRSIGALLDVTVAKKVEGDLRWAANHDPLTGLPNRKLFGEVLERALEEGAATAGCVGVIVIDVDSFKQINDSLGHAAGDAVLKTVAARIQSNLSGDATVARLGGDEFAIILPGLKPEDACAATVDRAIDGVTDMLMIDESVVPISISAGAAMWPRDGANAEAILKSADLALYAAKAEGAGAIRGFRPAMREAVEHRKAMLRDAREALRDDRVLPFYQAKIDLETGEVAGFEALLRWQHHGRGLQPPLGIEAAFDDSLLSTQLTDRMLDRVLADMARFAERGVDFGRIAINGAAEDFRRGNFADRILGQFQRAGLSPALLELEVTESVFVGQNAHHVESALRTLVAEGVTIALDDFGTGYASLTHLQQFPVHVVKIDRSFISRLDGSDSPDLAIVHGVIDIAHRLKIVTVAEGVENEEQAARLRELGCDLGQGFLFSRAISAERVPAWIGKWQSGGAGRATVTGLSGPPDRRAGGRSSDPS